MRSLPAILLVCALAALGAPATGSPAQQPRDTPASAKPGPDDPGSTQTSDGVRGEIAAPLPPTARQAPRNTAVRRQWTVAPGVRAMSWDERDARGPVRAHLLTIDYRTKGLRLDYANAGAVRSTAPVSTILDRSNAIAGVNGDFFDIGDTGAPLGLGLDRDRGLLNGRISGWNQAFYFDRRNRPAIGDLPMTARIKQRPKMAVTNVNSASVAPGGIGVYNARWGTTSGYRITDGQTKRVRKVVLRKGRVVRNNATLPSGSPIKGTMLVGRDKGARQLRGLKRGERITVRRNLSGRPQMAITGNRILLDDGLIKVVDDREMHPRTAIGIDRDTRQILLLLVDGRQSFSRGYTMVELANLMIDLGADEALNLDGGGSSTMVARRPNGNVNVINSPSDGGQRSVPNAIEVTYRGR